MKKQLFKAISKRVSTVVLAVLILTAASQKSFALPNVPFSKSAEISYKGFKDNKLVFNVNYKNEFAQPFQLVIKNEQNEVIYSQPFAAQPLNTTLLFSEVPEKTRLTFLIKTGKKEVSQSFEINTQVKTVEEYIVKGL